LDGESPCVLSTRVNVTDLKNNAGANGALAALESVASKAAYLLHMIAIELHKASKEIDLTVS